MRALNPISVRSVRMLSVKRLVYVSSVLLCAIFTNVQCTNAPSVIIVGAGAAGIAGASKLLKNNVTDVVILEAEGRLGGRIHSVHFGDAVVDLGAQYCHGEKGNVVYDMVNGLDFLGSADMIYNFVFSNGQEADQQLLLDLYDLASSLYNGNMSNGISFEEHFFNNYNTSVLIKYGDDPHVLHTAKVFVDAFMTMTLMVEGAFSWTRLPANSDYVEVKGNQVLNWKGRGYKTILNFMMKNLPVEENIIFKKEVVAVSWNTTGKAKVKCSDGAVYSADHVIFTPSLGALKHQHLGLFEPALPDDKVTAIEKLGIEGVAKVFFHFPTRWWLERNVSSFTFIWTEDDKKAAAKDFPHGPIKDGLSWVLNLFNVFVEENNPNVLAAWYGGEFVPAIELCSDDMLVEGLMYVLGKFLKQKFSDISRPDSLIRHTWYNNPYFRGTYSFQTLESQEIGASQEVVLSQPLGPAGGHERLLFAGEATHPIYYSTVHGAIETGWREAERIIEYYQ